MTTTTIVSAAALDLARAQLVQSRLATRILRGRPVSQEAMEQADTALACARNVYVRARAEAALAAAEALRASA